MFGNLYCWHFKCLDLYDSSDGKRIDLVSARVRSDWPFVLLMLFFSARVACAFCHAQDAGFDHVTSAFEVDDGRENLSLFCLNCVLFLSFQDSKIYGD